jgi:hypothetical protein
MLIEISFNRVSLKQILRFMPKVSELLSSAFARLSDATMNAVHVVHCDHGIAQ